MLNKKFKGKVLFVFSDPGGAKPCLSFIEESNLINVTAISDRKYPFYKDFITPVKIIKGGFERVIDLENPDLIFTGTSYRSDIEQQFIKIALKKYIPCYSFVDHWTAISERFENSAGERTLPDQIWVIDERAKQLAIEQRIDKKKLVISGNPYHEWLLKWRPKITKEEYMLQIGLKDNNKKLLLYAPDPLSNINGKEKYGFDEISATSDLLKLFIENKMVLRDWTVLLKLHPNQDEEKLAKLISGNSSFYLLPKAIDTNLAIYYSDVVMGFFSSLLIEASILNKYILRFIVTDANNDPIGNLNIGPIVSKTNFLSELKAIVK